MRKQGRLITNMTSYAVLQIINMLVGLFLPRLYLEVYGSEINGVISTANSFISYFSYLEAGIGLTLIHSLFKPLAENNIISTNEILSYAQKQYRKISGIYFVLVVGLSLIFPLIGSVKELGGIEFTLLVFVIGLYGAIDFLAMAKYRVLLTADRKEYVISNAMILAQLLRFIFVWLMLQFNISVVFVKIIPILTLLVRTLILRTYIKKHYPYADYSVPPTKDCSVTSKRWDALLLQISINTSVSLPAIIISRVLGFKEANVYAMYGLVASSMISIVSALSSGVAPKIGQKIARNENVNRLYRIYNYIVSIIITILFSTMAIMTIPFIQLYTSVVNDVNYLYPTYAVLISLWAALYSYRIPLTAIINAAGIYTENRVNNIINLVIQVLGGIIAGTLWGIPGLLVVMILASIQRNIGFAYNNSKKVLHNGIITSIVYQVIMSSIICVSYFVIFPVISAIEYNILSWILVATGVLIIETIVTLVIYMLIDISCTKQVIMFVCSAIFKWK